MLIPAKLSCSYRLQNNIGRTRLVNLLNSAKQYPLVLIHAPAGYGKTTLISQWAADKENVGWYSLDEGDNKAERFAMYFNTALAYAMNAELPEQQLERQANFSAQLDQSLLRVSNFPQHLYLVIDDYHLIENDEIHDGVKYWIKHQPQNMTLILISRTQPPLGIASLRVQELLLEIDVNQLTFTHQESLQFFQHRLGNAVNESDCIALCEQVEGWATALQLISLSAKQHHSNLHSLAKRLSNLSNMHIREYLNEEVLNAVDESTKQFLLRCSILRSMNEQLVEAITGDKNACKRLEEIEKQGLFLSQTNEAGWWRFHPMFASFLSHCCRIELHSELEQLHQRAAQTWLKLGYPTEALYHSMQLSDTAVLLTILCERAWELFHHGEIKLVEEGLERISLSELVQYPKLILLKAWLAQSTHRHNEVNGILAEFEQGLQQQNIQLTKQYQAEFDVLRAQVAINDGNQQLAFELSSNALKNLHNAFYAEIVATSIIGEAYHCYGDLNQALAMLQRAEKMARQHHTYHNVLWSLLQQAEILLAQGFPQAAYDMLDKARDFVQENHLQKVPMYEFLLRLKSKILYEWYNLDKAEAMAYAGIEVLEKDEEALQCLALLAKISLVRGNLDNATRLLQQINGLQHNHQYHYDWLANADEAKILLWQMQNNQQQAKTWLQQSHQPHSDKNHFSQIQWRNIVRCHLLLGEFEQGENILNRLIATAEQLNLISDLNRGLILRNRLYFLQQKKAQAQQDLLKALKLSRQTNFISAFVVEGDIMAQQIRQLLPLNLLDELALHKAQFILRHINQYYRHKFAHFDEQFVASLLQNPKVPELLRISPLTQREWQVLGLIYSGYTNDQICDELQVAITTIKTHIRNLYQKIGVSNRAEAIDYTKELLLLMGYH